MHPLSEKRRRSFAFFRIAALRFENSPSSAGAPSILPFSILPFSIFPFSILPFSIFPFSILPFSIFPFSILPYFNPSFFNPPFFNPPFFNLSFEKAQQGRVKGARRPRCRRLRMHTTAPSTFFESTRTKNAASAIHGSRVGFFMIERAQFSAFGSLCVG